MARDKRLDVAERAADVALVARPVPLRILDVSCGDGLLLAELVLRAPYCEAYVGVDGPAPVAAARAAADPRVTFVCGAPHALPFADASFDLVLAGDSFDAWPDQAAGVAELARVLDPGGVAVLVDHTRRAADGLPERAHSAKAIAALLGPVGLQVRGREPLVRGPLAVAATQAVVAGR